MEREVVRIVTPGTITDEALLDERRDNVLASVCGADGRFGLAWLDLSAGRFSVMELAGSAALEAELERLRPAELLAPDGAEPPAAAGTPASDRRCDCGRRGISTLDSATRALCEQFHTRDLAGFGCADKPLAVAAAGALLAYVRETQKAALPHLLSLATEEHDGALIMDPATRRNLELDESLAGKPELTLAGVFDRTATAMGGRMLRRWLHRPLRDREALRARYQAVATLIEASRHLRSPNRCAISATWSASWRGSPCARRGREISPNCARRSAHYRRCIRRCVPCRRRHPPRCLSSFSRNSAITRDEHALLIRAVVDSPPHFLRDGGVIAPGYDAELDELRLLGSNTEQFLLDLERRERERSGLSSLKLGFNRVQGFFIEVSRAQADAVPKDYQRRQTVKSAERFITPELKAFEDKVLGARDRAAAREKELYDGLLDLLTARLPALQRTTVEYCAARRAHLLRRTRRDARLRTARAGAGADAPDRQRPPSGGRAGQPGALHSERRALR